MPERSKLILLLCLMGLLDAVHAKDKPWSPCYLSHPRLAQTIAAQCAHFEIPLDHANPQGGGFTARVVRISARGPDNKPDPVWFLAGGPGQSAIDNGLLLWGLFSQLRSQRELIFVDQRGTGASAPLNCPQDESQMLQADTAALVRQARRCLDELEADPKLFTTLQSVEDIEWLRRRLGYAHINLVGVSYGTRLAQSYARKYPQHLRSQVLDGVLPPQKLLGPEFSMLLKRVVERVIEDCQSDSECQAFFPRLRQHWQAYQTIPLTGKRQLVLEHPRSGEKLALQVSRESLDGALRLLSYSSETQALLPLLLHQVARGNWLPLLRQALIVAADVGPSISLGLNYSVACSEDVPFYSAQVAETNQVLGRFQAQLQALCAIWPHTPVSADFHQPMRDSPVPTLLLSGELDPVTPPEYAELAARQYRQAWSLELKGQGHNVLPRGCVARVAAHFIAHLEPPDDAGECMAKSARLPFFIDMLGPGA